MTARVKHGSTLQITASPGQRSRDVIDSYKRELKAQGHDLRHTPRAGVTVLIKCRECHRQLRSYIGIGVQTGITIYSEFQEEEQCPRRQIQLHTGPP